MRHLRYAETYASSAYVSVGECLADVACWLYKQDERTLTVISIEVDLAEDALYYVTVTVERI